MLFLIDYLLHIRRCLVSLSDRHFPKFMRGEDNDDFYFSKIFKNFSNFLPKEQLEGILIIMALHLNRKNNKNRKI